MKTFYLTAIAKCILLFFIGIYSSSTSFSQVVQTSIGTSGPAEIYNDVKLDPNDGGSVNVVANDFGNGNGNHLFIVKLNSNHIPVWQWSYSNPGDDHFYKVAICANLIMLR